MLLKKMHSILSGLYAFSAFNVASAWVPLPDLTCRNQNTWPFSNISVWNTPLGSGAIFVLAQLFSPGLGPPIKIQSDDDYFIITSSSDPVVPWYNQGRWGGPNTPQAYCTVTGPLVRSINFPVTVNITTFGNNNAAAILLPDGDTLQLMQPLYVCGSGSPVLALEFSPSQNSTSIRGLGTLGGHGGSGLNAIGGTIRLGEMLPDAPPISHALKLEFFANLYYFRPPSGNRSQCFHWPAVQCDGYCFDCAANPHECYNGTNPLLTPGALLAVAAADALRLNASMRTPPGRRILSALATYGGYIVDDTAWNATSICTEHGVQAEFAAATVLLAVCASTPTANPLSTPMSPAGMGCDVRALHWVLLLKRPGGHWPGRV